MYENQTYEVILQRMLDRVPDNIDKREGSIIYDALAPAAAELAQMYIEIDLQNNLAYTDTATGEYLERRTAEFGVHRLPATKARRKGLFYGEGNNPIDAPVGSRFSIQGLTYVVISKINIGEFELECEVSGIIGNQQFGSLLPLDFIQGLVSAELAEVIVAGADAESDEALRQRYYETVNEPSFGGNVADYKQKVKSISGIGGVKVTPTWQGGGTVKCTIIASDYNTPAQQLVDDVQEIIDPAPQGEGLGQAPIGHTVTIVGVFDETIDLETTVTLEPSMTIGQVQDDIEAVFEEYLLDLRQSWEDETNIIVRIAQIEARILNVPGIVDVTDTKLNGVGANVELDSEEIPVIGQVVVNE